MLAYTDGVATAITAIQNTVACARIRLASREIVHPAKSAMNGSTGFRYRLAGAVLAMNRRNGSGNASRSAARAGEVAIIQTAPAIARTTIGCPAESFHSISR